MSAGDIASSGAILLAIALPPIVAVWYGRRQVTRTRAFFTAWLIADFGEIIRLDPNDLNGYLKRATAVFNRREFDSSIADLTEAIRIDPSLAEAFGIRGRAWFVKNDHEKAIADLTEAIRLEPEEVGTYSAPWRSTMRTELRTALPTAPALSVRIRKMS